MLRERPIPCHTSEITSAYGITLADVYAALAYSHDHRAEIDRAMHEDTAFVEELRQHTPSKIGG